MSSSPTSSDSSTHQFRPTSQVLGKSDCAVFSYSTTNELTRQPVSQLSHADGKLYIEYLPGHNVVFLPTQIPIEKSMRRLRKSLQPRDPPPARKPTNVPAKPNNAFIRYRSYRLQDIKQLYPNASQIDLSRIAAEHWRTEDPEIKGYFQNQYKEELQFYHQQQKIHHMAERFHAERHLPPPLSNYMIAAPVSHEEHVVDFSPFGGPSNFQPKRRRSQSVPSDVSLLKRFRK
ncbi:hypothetical protein IWW52_002690 [Coemansia sp. RSA 2704]|nr:hypothetical protein IWW54_002601 [Coemansia sp. RSA 2705]KAJ2318209.1 hypothetical protein IWW52_002690 [Coemansia sp. RSA 2704]